MVLRPPRSTPTVPRVPYTTLFRSALLGRTGVASDLQQLGGALDRDVLDRVALAQRRVGLAVGDVGPEAAVLHDDGLLGHRVVPQLLERRSGCCLAAPELLGLGEYLPRFVPKIASAPGRERVVQ